VKGIEETRRRLMYIEAGLVAGLEDGMQKAAEHVLGVSKDQAPIEEGTLIRSGQTRVSVEVGPKVRASIGYGGSAAVNVAGTGDQNVSPAAYAVVQHEDLTLAHDPGRTAKFLEKALNSERRIVTDIVATSVKTRIAQAARRS
jgi:hypothetical protein